MSELETIDGLWRRERASYLKEMAREGLLDYCRALLVIAGADGKITEPELAWLRDELVRTTGGTELLDELKDFDWRFADLRLILARVVQEAAAVEESDDPDLPGNVCRSLLYDCIRMAWADEELAHEELTAIRKAAAILGVKEHTCRALHGLVEMEKAVKKLRYSLLGHD